jgi:large subunit ribosomal protein L10
VKKSKKLEIVEELKKELADAPAVLVVEYKGTSVAQMQELRGELRKEDGKFRVVKNTLLQQAIIDTPNEALNDSMGGQIAIAWCDDDPGFPAKVLVKFAKDNESMVVRGGVMGGKALTAEGVVQLSELPTLPEMRSKFAGLLMAVPRDLLGVFSAPHRDILGVLKAREGQLNEAA